MQYIRGKYPTIAVDFDGVIVDFAFPKIGKLKKGAKEALTLLKKMGAFIIIHSARTDMTFTPNISKIPLQEMISFLQQNNIPYDIIWQLPGKPVADIYIDDKGLRFTNWAETLKTILSLIHN